MSGAASLSAAKRRRATVENDMNKINTQQSENSNNTKNLTTISYGKVLDFHEERLNILDQNISVLQEQQYTLDDNMKILLQTSEDKYKLLENNIDKLSKKKSYNGNSNESPETIQYFRDKVDLLEKQITDLKTLVLRVQNFAMDSKLVSNNLSNDEIKKDLNINLKIDDINLNEENTENIEN